MDLKLVGLLLVLCASIGTIKGAFPTCCLNVSPKFSKELLNQVKKFTYQKPSASCEVEAVVLHLKNNKKICAAPRVLSRLKRNNILQSIRRAYGS
ncbi:C-C motif chemokine 28 [Paramormyrops kingsleyae]|uniref:C-C motif chemokine 28 n=1 Tax=Paramormyrops kingsleyae TaxID=1676925 RepID=UPI003B96F903